MAVKHKIVENMESQQRIDLTQILRVLQTINAEHQFHECNLPKICETIVYNLGNVKVPSQPTEYLHFMRDIKTIETILVQACNSNEVVFETLRAFYSAISDPNKHYQPTMAIVLGLINVDTIPSAVKWILQYGYSDRNLEAALLTLCNWLSHWTYTPNLGPLVLLFIKGLENEQHYEILIEVTLLYIERLFKLVILPEVRNAVGPVVIHMLSSMQHNAGGFHKILPHAPMIIRSLSKEGTESSLSYLEEFVNLFVSLMSQFPSQNLYEELIVAIKPFKSSIRGDYAINYKPWIERRNFHISLQDETRKVGLNNLGNTCYMNSILQALFMTKLFRNDVLLMDKEMLPLFSRLQALFTLLQFSRRRSLSPVDILELGRPPTFLPGQQHDSSEFLCYLLDALHEQEKSKLTDTSQITVTQRSFGGRAVTISKCGQCDTKSEYADYFRELQLSFPGNCDNPSVQILLDYYFQMERLAGDNQYHCNNCGGLTDGERITKIVEAPARLVLTLKNFHFDSESQQRKKLLQEVKLDSCVRVNNMNYELYAAVVHAGSCLDSGHYYTYAHDGDTWYKFNDCVVTKTSPEELCSMKPPESAYILFYSKHDCLDPDSISRTALSPLLESILVKDTAQYDLEKGVFPKVSHNNINRRNDDPPPPGCGGDSFLNNQSGRYVY